MDVQNSISIVDPDVEVEKHRHWLPHWQQKGISYFVTWRLADSLPHEYLEKWSDEKRRWLATHPEPWTVSTRMNYYHRFAHEMETCLDRGYGSCLLKEPVYAHLLAKTLFHFDEQRYLLDSFVIMPNHVHILFSLFESSRLEDVIRSWKSFSARAINDVSFRKGSLWQEEYWDRMIRSERHLLKCREYIQTNPIKAGLKAGAYLLYSIILTD